MSRSNKNEEMNEGNELKTSGKVEFYGMILLILFLTLSLLVIFRKKILKLFAHIISTNKKMAAMIAIENIKPEELKESFNDLIDKLNGLDPVITKITNARDEESLKSALKVHKARKCDFIKSSMYFSQILSELYVEKNSPVEILLKCMQLHNSVFFSIEKDKFSREIRDLIVSTANLLKNQSMLILCNLKEIKNEPFSINLKSLSITKLEKAMNARD